jgi:hypothetical protein
MIDLHRLIQPALVAVTCDHQDIRVGEIRQLYRCPKATVTGLP